MGFTEAIPYRPAVAGYSMPQVEDMYCNEDDFRPVDEGELTPIDEEVEPDEFDDDL